MWVIQVIKECWLIFSLKLHKVLVFVKRTVKENILRGKHIVEGIHISSGLTMSVRKRGRNIRGREARMKHNQLLSRQHSEYKKFIDKKQMQFSNYIAQRLKECRISDPKGFWKILGGNSKPTKENNISFECFKKKHFQV